MSRLPDKEPEVVHPAATSIDLSIDARSRDLGGGFTVRRVLPSIDRRLVGPFIFFDHMGPTQLGAGEGLDVRPHPHVCLATLTYLFDGEIVHCDSIGSVQTIRPGDVNWMIAGRGIAHSERSPTEARVAGARAHGIQCWCALSTSDEERAPSFEHTAEKDIPRWEEDGVQLRIVAGSAFGRASPVGVLSPTLYVEAKLEDGARLALPEEHAERAAYVVAGAIACEELVVGEGSMLVFRRDTHAVIRARGPAHVMLLGGEPLDGERHIWWNFVASRRERIERAKSDWKDGKFAKVAGDEVEFIPLP